MSRSFLNILLELFKVRITFFVTVTTSFGYIAHKAVIDSGIILPTIATLLLAFGSAAFNHYQEKDTDVMMERTKNRPIPAGKISANSVLIISISAIVIGSFLLFLCSPIVAILGILNLVWYNFIYTPLKKRTTLAIVPGALVGAIPPVIGWVAAGGAIIDPQIIAIASFFFIWQIPHFWLLLLVFQDDYRKAGFPVLTDKFSNVQLTRITFVWIIATMVTGFLIPLFKIIELNWIIYSMFIVGFYFIWKASELIRNKNIENSNYRFAFNSINIFALYLVAAVSLEKLIF